MMRVRSKSGKYSETNAAVCWCEAPPSLHCVGPKGVEAGRQAACHLSQHVHTPTHTKKHTQTHTVGFIIILKICQ